MVFKLIVNALRQPFLMVTLALATLLGGIWAFAQLPVDAYPDLSAPTVEVITQWPGHAAEEVERLITIPLEKAFNGAPRLVVLRSISLYGLSDIRMTFAEDADRYFARGQIFQRLGDASLPSGITPSLAPLFSPSGLIYRYVLQSPDRSPEELKVLQDWVLFRHYKSITGVAEDSGFGGATRQYQVILDPALLNTYKVAVQDVVDALGNDNVNAGGGFFQSGGQFYYVRGLGRLTNLEDIGEVVVTTRKGVPIRVRNLGEVAIGHAPRLGKFGFMKDDDAVEGVIFLRTGDAAQTVLARVEQMTRYLNEHVLPRDVRVKAYYDRSDLIALTTRTVEDNLLLGVLMVTLILVLFLRSVRAGLIVAATIPLALATAFLLLKARNVPVNLLSLGAVDFGILVDAAVIMVENIFRELGARRAAQETVDFGEVLQAAARDVGRPIFYSTAVIIAGYLPIYALTGPSSRLFSPMADTVVFALLGTLIFTLTLLPVLCAIFLRNVKDEEGPLMSRLTAWYARALDRCFAWPRATLAACVGLFLLSLLALFGIGAEFMPRLDEGALWVRATMPYTISLDAAEKIAPQVREILLSFPEVTTVASELGRPDDGTNPTGFYNCEFYVGLKPYGEWPPGMNKPALVAAVGEKLKKFPGIIFNYTQPAQDAVDEAATGLKSSLAVKVFGPDLHQLEGLAEKVRRSISTVRGIADITIVRELGQPSLDVTIDRRKVARYGLNVAAVNRLIASAVGGVPATQVIEGERTFDLVVRMSEAYRDSPEAIGRLLVTTPGGQRIPLASLATLKVGQGASFIYREASARYIGLQYSVTGRDLGSAVGEAREKVDREVKLPVGYELQWGGEYSDFLNARREMLIIIPLTLVLMFFILFGLYGNAKYPLMIAISAILNETPGALLALWAFGTNLSVSSGLGFLALYGVSMQTGIIFISHANKLRQDGVAIDEAARQSAIVRLRPILITAIVACLGLLPAAFSHAIGSDSQRPFAQVVVGGLTSRVVLSVFLLPVLYRWFSSRKDRLEV